ncbi:MAG TPA: hypothetical protein VF771_07125 [Longimicrobiaceae bacterium]
MLSLPMDRVAGLRMTSGGVRRIAAGMMVAMATTFIAACRDEGGELKEVTERRRAEMANRDTSADSGSDTAGPDTGYAIPTFVGDTPKAAARADTAAKDTARQAPPSADGFTADPRQGRHGNAIGILRGYRVAQREGFDRLVLDFGTGAVPSWTVEYTDQAYGCGSGQPVRLAGSARLRVNLPHAQAHDEAGAPTVRQRDVALQLPTLRQLAVTCDFEGQVEMVLGLAARRPYRVLELQNPSRLVIDVQQQP